ncbi:hypothetical protein DOK67_0001297 [Enterococcus sp. DIV0212c]
MYFKDLKFEKRYSEAQGNKILEYMFKFDKLR